MQTIEEVDGLSQYVIPFEDEELTKHDENQNN
jgi:hypothetical protein